MPRVCLAHETACLSQSSVSRRLISDGSDRRENGTHNVIRQSIDKSIKKHLIAYFQKRETKVETGFALLAHLLITCPPHPPCHFIILRLP
jgi:hypothetical protein